MGRMRRVVGGVLTALLNCANTTSTASSAPAANCAINGPTSSAAWAAVGLSPISVRCDAIGRFAARSEEHTSELQSLTNLVCRLLLEKKKRTHRINMIGSGADRTMLSA